MLFDRLIAIDVSVQDINFAKNMPAPWFTGPLVAPGGYVLKKGHFNAQPYMYANFMNYNYDSSWKRHAIDPIVIGTFRVPLKVGVGGGVDLGITPIFMSKFTQGKAGVGVSDWIIVSNVQLLFAELDDPWPAIKLNMKLTLPFGKYQQLNPEKARTDVRGEGSWWPAIGLHSSKLWHLYGLHYFELRFAAEYFIATPVAVSGYNTYGGAANTEARVFNGNVIILDLAAQYNLTQHWALALDIVYKHKNKTRASGFQGTTSSGLPVSLQKPSNENFSMAPALEYNFSKNMGLIAGCWFSFAGRNSPEFTIAALSLNLYY